MPDREQALQSVLSFIAEQQIYLAEMPSDPAARPFSADGMLSLYVIERKIDVSLNSNKVKYITTAADVTPDAINSDDLSDEAKDGFTEKSNQDLLDEIPVPPMAPEERIVSAVVCNGGVSYTSVAPSELGAVPEEDEEAATSSTPSTVVRT